MEMNSPQASLAVKLSVKFSDYSSKKGAAGLHYKNLDSCVARPTSDMKTQHCCFSAKAIINNKSMNECGYVSYSCIY